MTLPNRYRTCNLSISTLCISAIFLYRFICFTTFLCISTRLSTNTLFCEYCSRPFLKEEVRKELTTAFTGFRDLISAILFLLVLWLPMTVCLFAAALATKVARLFKAVARADNEEEYDASDFDKEVCRAFGCSPSYQLTMSLLNSICRINSDRFKELNPVGIQQFWS